MRLHLTLASKLPCTLLGSHTTRWHLALPQFSGHCCGLCCTSGVRKVIFNVQVSLRFDSFRFSFFTDGTRRGSCHLLIVHRCLGVFVLRSLAALHGWAFKSVRSFLCSTRLYRITSPTLSGSARRKSDNWKTRTKRSARIESEDFPVFCQLSDYRSLPDVLVPRDAFDVESSNLVREKTPRARHHRLAGRHP